AWSGSASSSSNSHRPESTNVPSSSNSHNSRRCHSHKRQSASVPSSNSRRQCNRHKSWSVNAPCSSSNRTINHPRLRACPLRHPSNRVRLPSALRKAARSNVRNNSNFRRGSNLSSSKTDRKNQIPADLVVKKRNKSSEAGHFLISSSSRNEMEEDRHYGL